MNPPFRRDGRPLVVGEGWELEARDDISVVVRQAGSRGVARRMVVAVTEGSSYTVHCSGKGGGACKIRIIGSWQIQCYSDGANPCESGRIIVAN